MKMDSRNLKFITLTVWPLVGLTALDFLRSMATDGLDAAKLLSLHFICTVVAPAIALAAFAYAGWALTTLSDGKGHCFANYRPSLWNLYFCRIGAVVTAIFSLAAAVHITLFTEVEFLTVSVDKTLLFLAEAALPIFLYSALVRGLEFGEERAAKKLKAAQQPCS